MILQALVKYYEDLVCLGKIAEEGWGVQKISYALCIDDDGNLEQVISVKQEVPSGKKTVILPQNINVPAAVKRTVGISSNFLWDNSAYLLGIAEGEKAKRAKDCFAACKAHHEAILRDVNSPGTRALLRFFENWNCETAAVHPALQEILADLLKGGNLVFRYNGCYLHDLPEFKAAWQAYNSTTDSADSITCLVTGRKDSLALLHPSIKGVPGAQSSGASLVSYNALSFCSYGHEQGANAPTGRYAAFAYGAALNHLIADRAHTSRVGDTLILAWADGGEEAFEDMWFDCLDPDRSAYDREELHQMMELLVKGKPVMVNETRIDPDRPFYILGISPNAARLSVRFFLRNTFGAFVRNVYEHQERLKIVKPNYETRESISIWALLNETVNQNSRDKNPSPVLAGELTRSVLMGTMYPATLLNALTIRIRADHEVNRNRAAMIKAFYLKNPNPLVPKEVLTVSLNPNSTSIPYQLGRLFATLERIQQTANPGINSTIKDKYFNSASAAPAVVFPTLVNLAQKHLRKIGGGLAFTLNREMAEIMASIEDSFPARLSLPEQGAFQLGYYHQTEARFNGTKKEEK